MSFEKWIRSFVTVGVFLFISTLIFSCKDSGSNVVPKKSSIKQQILPNKKAGLITQKASSFRAEAKSGYVFSYWKIISSSDTAYSINKDLQATTDSTKKIVANFNEIQTTFKGYISSHDGKYVYFISWLNDHSGKISYALFKYNVETGGKDVLYRSNHPSQQLTQLHISADDRFLSFAKSRKKGSGNDVYIFDTEKGSSREIAAGLNSAWANNSNRLMSANDRGMYIYETKSYFTEYISDLPFSDEINVVPDLTDAKWSPNDKKILLGEISKQDNGKFYYYSFSKQKIIQKTVPDLATGTFFAWINNSDFFIVGNSPSYQLFLNSFSTSKPVQNLSVKTYYEVGISPDKKRLAFSSDYPPGNPESVLSIYDIDQDIVEPLLKNPLQINEITKYVSIGDVKWNNDTFILTRTIPEHLIMVSYPDGSITQI